MDMGWVFVGGFRDPNSPNVDKVILMVIGNSETIERRNALGIIAIRVDDLLIPGGDFL